MECFQNPILKGFYPDPSVCRVGEDYYLVTSTFTYFPGVPIFHSKDLIHWKQIGNILDRESQIPLSNGGHSMGIFAPTLRYHNGLFYMITTNVCNGGNFIVTAEDPKGPWSEPYWLNSDGIDPSLFFDDDGRCYYCGTQDRREGSKYYGDNEIFLQELDLTSMKLIGDTYPIWHGALRGVVWPEGPHIYKKDGWYYLLISEAGTAHEHAVTIARSRNIFEPFVGNKSNPILTHRHLGESYPIVNVGHPDIVETQNGEWWMVLLASRPYGGYYRNLGRETFLAPMIWEKGWPIVNPGVGKVEFQTPIPNLPYDEPEVPEEKEDFNDAQLPMHFIYSRNPIVNNYSLDERPGYLRMYLSPVQLYEEKSPTFVCQRQQAMRFSAETKLDFCPDEGEKAGLTLYQSNAFYYACYITCEKGVKMICVSSCKDGKEEIVEKSVLDEEKHVIQIKVHANNQELSFSYKTDKDYSVIAKKLDARILSTDVAGGFVGTCIGIYGSLHDSSAVSTDRHYADFDWLKVTNFD